MSKNISNQYFDLQVHLPGIVIFHKFFIFFTTMLGYAGLLESSMKIVERDEALRISCRACLFFIVFWSQKKNI